MNLSYVTGPMRPRTSVELEGQSCIQVHNNCFSCTLHETTESRFPICPRNRIYHAGTILPVGELSIVDGVFSLCIPSSVDFMRWNCFRCPKLNYAACELGSRLHEIRSESFDSYSVRSLCIPSSVRNLLDSVSRFPETLEVITFEPSEQCILDEEYSRAVFGDGHVYIVGRGNFALRRH